MDSTWERALRLAIGPVTLIGSILLANWIDNSKALVAWLQTIGSAEFAIAIATAGGAVAIGFLISSVTVVVFWVLRNIHWWLDVETPFPKSTLTKMKAQLGAAKVPNRCGYSDRLVTCVIYQRSEMPQDFQGWLQRRWHALGICYNAIAGLWGGVLLQAVLPRLQINAPDEFVVFANRPFPPSLWTIAGVISGVLFLQALIIRGELRRGTELFVELCSNGFKPHGNSPIEGSPN